jgi:hypothetical protein
MYVRAYGRTNRKKCYEYYAQKLKTAAQYTVSSTLCSNTDSMKPGIAVIPEAG